MTSTDPNEVKAAWILGLIAIAEGAWVAFNFWVSPQGFANFLGFAPGRAGSAAGWALATFFTALFVYYSARLPSVRANLVRPSFLKVLAIAVGLAAGILEEAFFRKLLMDYLDRQGIGAIAQILASTAAFGVAHGIWGLMGRSLSAARNAMVATAVLGFALALVYVVAGRSLAPCIAAHFLIDALIEPGLVLAATRGEMGRLRGPPQKSGAL